MSTREEVEQRLREEFEANLGDQVQEIYEKEIEDDEERHLEAIQERLQEEFEANLGDKVEMLVKAAQVVGRGAL